MAQFVIAMIRCIFCNDSDIIGCMNYSLHSKHCQESTAESKLINRLIKEEKSPLVNRYLELGLRADNREHMRGMITKKAAKKEHAQLLEYYKYRIFSATSDSIHSYYFNRLKLHYNSVKKKLNISIEPTEETHTVTYGITGSSASWEGSLLKQIKDKSAILETQSKALEGLLAELRLNSKFNEIESPFNEENIFQGTFKKKKSVTISMQVARLTPISKMYKQVVHPKHERPSERLEGSKSHSKLRQKVVVSTDRLKNDQFRIRNTNSHHSLPKGKSTKISLEKSPYRQTFQKSNSRVNVEKGKPKSISDLSKRVPSKEKFLQIRGLIPTQSVPASPRRSKARVTEIKIEKNDNLFSVRMKKLEALKCSLRK